MSFPENVIFGNAGEVILFYLFSSVYQEGYVKLKYSDLI